MSEQTFQLVEALRIRLQAVIRRITLAELAYGFVLTLGILTSLWVLLVAIEAGFWLDTTPRAFVFWIMLAVSLGLLGYFLILPLLRLTGLLKGPSHEAIALRIGRSYPEIADRLVNLLQLVDGRHSGGGGPNPLLDGAVQMLGAQVQPVPFEAMEDFGRVRRASRFATVPILSLLVFLLAAPTTFIDASKRLLSPGLTFSRPAPFQFIIEPGSVELVKGASLEITLHTSGTVIPHEVTLSLNNLEEDAAPSIPLKPDADGVFRHTVVNIRHSLRYRASAMGVNSDWHTATVTERPIVRGLQVSLDFPSYTRIPPQRLEPNVGDITALPGTRVALDIGLGGNEVVEAFIRFDDERLDTLAIEGGSANGTFSLRQEGTYQILLRNARGVENAAPISYQIKLLSDAYPAIVLLAPEPLTDLNETLRTGLRFRINDDFGFYRLHLHYRLAESRFGQPSTDFTAHDLPLDDRTQLDQELAFDWRLPETDLDPVPGDVIEYYLEIRDNDAVAGFKSAASALYRLRMPSLAEQYEALDQQQDETQDELEDLKREAEEVKEQFQELRDELRRKPEADWEDQRQVERVQEKQKAMEERVEDLARQLDSMNEDMKDNSLVSEETMEMFNELEKVIDEIKAPEMMEALRKLQEAMQNMNLQQMQQSVENFEFSEEQYRKRLERTLDLFKQLRVQQDLEEVARRAEDLAALQEKLEKETAQLEKEKEGQQKDGEQKDGQQKDGEQKDGQQKDGEQKDGQQKDGEQKDGQQKDGEQKDGQQKDGEQKDGQQKDGEQKDGQQKDQKEALAQEQEQSKEEMEALQKKMEEILERMEELRRAPSEQMEQLMEEVEQQKLPQQMQKNADQLRQEQNKEAQKGQQQMQQQLQQMQQKLQQMQQGMQGQQQQMNMAGLRRALSDVLTLSQQQEALRGEVRGLASDSPQLRTFAQHQTELTEGLRVVSDSLQSLAKDIPQMSREVQQYAGEALREMGSATESMAERIARRASGHQKGAMTHLNELALLLSDLLNQMMNSQGGGSGSMSMQQMIQQMQDMAGQQQQLNAQIQQLLNDMQGNRMTSDMQERLRQLGGQQDKIRQDLKQMSRNKELRGQTLGDLNRIAEQMEETIQELQLGRVNRTTVSRQQQILTRLLDATRSMQERGKEKRRQAETGENFTRESPSDLSPSEQAEKLRRDLIRALESGYAPDYEELIKRYFELLQQDAVEQ